MCLLLLVFVLRIFQRPGSLQDVRFVLFGKLSVHVSLYIILCNVTLQVCQCMTVYTC